MSTVKEKGGEFLGRRKDRKQAGGRTGRSAGARAEPSRTAVGWAARWSDWDQKRGERRREMWFRSGLGGQAGRGGSGG
jgi:hypothetical protein